MNTPSRRNFLQLGWKLGVGAIVTLNLSSCGGADNSTPTETFVEPTMLKSENGLLDVTLTIAYANTILDGKNVTLRTFNQSIPAPTLSINTGDMLRIRVINLLPPNPPSTDPVHLRYQNNTNLHTHGLHVNPGRQIVALGSVEEWTVYNMDSFQHPFHIHVNPFLVTKINGIPVEKPYWADTIALPLGGSPENPTSITFRTRFLDFKGTFVMHCHILVHEDMGMMQAIEVV